jgi:hypothetical protein
VEVKASGTRETTAFHASHLSRATRRNTRCNASFNSTPQAMVQLVRDSWNIECWHWIWDTQLHEDAHHDRGNGASPGEIRPGLRL